MIADPFRSHEGMNQGGKKSWWALGLIITVTLLVFSQSFDFDYVDYDDPAYVSGNPYVNQGLTAKSLRWAWTYAPDPIAEESLHPGVTNLWHPLTWISHMIDVQCWGANSPGRHHMSSVLLHLGSAVLVFLLFGRLFDSLWVGSFTALLFAIHPLQVEAVAWISGRKDQLSAFFMFASLYSYLRISAAKHRRARLWKGLSVSLYAMALCSKPSVVVMPALLVLIDYQRVGQGLVIHGGPGNSIRGVFRGIIRLLREKWLWIVPAVIVAAVTLITQQGGSHAFWIERSNLIDRVLLFGPAVCYYILRCLVPVNLSFHYSCPAWVMQGWVILGCFLVVAGVLLICYRSRTKTPQAWFACLWFMVLIVPVSGMAYVGTSFTSDRYMYTTLTGVFAALAYGLSRFPLRTSYLAGSVIIAVLVPLSFIQTTHWRDSKALFTHAIEVQPKDKVGYVNMGSLHQREGRYPQAITCYETVIQMVRHDYISWFNLGNCRNKTGDPLGAIDAYRSSLKIFPHYNPSRFNLAYLLLNPNTSYHDLDEATHLLKSIRKSGSYRGSKVDLLLSVAADLKRQRG